MNLEIFGIWIAAMLTIFILSFLYKDNPLYKFAEHLFVGVSAGYWLSYQFNNVLKPNLFNKLFPGTPGVESQYIYIIPGILGILMLLRLVPRISWISRWALSFIVGATAAITIYSYMQAQIIAQIKATMLPLYIPGDWKQTIFYNWVIIIGVCCGLIYFYFSKEHKGLFFGTASKIGIWCLMIAFGASFGYTVMARISLLIGRIYFLKNDWWPTLDYLGIKWPFIVAIILILILLVSKNLLQAAKK